MTPSPLIHREARPDGEARGTLLAVHGYPESSHMWRDLLPAAAAEGFRSVAPDLPGYGDSPLGGRPGTWTSHVEALGEFVADQGLSPTVLVTHDWGALIGLRWAVTHPEQVRALVIADSGFFPDGRWHGLAEVMRTEGQGEEVVAGIDRAGFGGMLGAVSTGMDDRDLDEYFKAYGDDERRAAQLAMYRSGEFTELAQYDGQLAAMDVPTLLLWGADDQFAPVAGGHRFKAEIPHAELVVLDGVGHFIFDDAPDQAVAAITDFLRDL